MGRKYITVSADISSWGEVPEGFDSGVEAHKICEAARQHGIVTYLDERPPMDMRDRGDEIDWWSVWCSEGYDWCDLDWSDFFAGHAVISAQDFVDSIHYPVVFLAGVGCPAGETIAILEGTDLPFLLDEVYGKVADEVFEATELTDGPGRDDWKFVDWNLNTIYKIQVFSDEKIWNEQNDDNE